MTVNVKDDSKDINYDYLFLAIELLKKIEIFKRLGDSINIIDYENQPGGISFSIETKKEIIDMYLQLVYNGRVFRLTLYTYEGDLEYEFDKRKEELLLENLTIYKDTKSLKRTVIYQSDKEYIYDLIDDNYGNLLLKYKAKKILDDQKLFSYLLGNSFDFNDMLDTISNQIINGSCYIMFQDDNIEETFNLIDNELVVVENNYFKEPVLTKKYKIN